MRRDGIKFSVRSERKGINAGKLIAAVLKEYGSGGGHYAMAGGFIPRENIDKMPGLQGPVENEFMKQINRMKRGSI